MLHDTKKVRISRRLSKILRHEALEYNLNIREDGYIKITDLVELPDFQDVKFDTLKEIVQQNPKNRFTIKNENNIWYIRANQGHSIPLVKTEKLLTQILIPCSCIHATNYRALESIKINGLNKMKRNTIHFSEKYPAEYISNENVIVTNVVPKLRYQVLIFIDMEKAMKDGIKFWKSDNGVILSEGINGIIDPKYFLSIKNINKN